MTSQAVSTMQSLKATLGQKFTLCFQTADKHRRKELKSILKGRLQCDAYRYKYSRTKSEERNTSNDDFLSPLQYYCLSRLEKTFLSSASRPGLVVFPSPHSICLQAGSFIIRMPAQEGRHALVVFAPGEESKQDIQYMLDDDACMNTVKRLKHDYTMLLDSS